MTKTEVEDNIWVPVVNLSSLSTVHSYLGVDGIYFSFEKFKL